LSLASFQRIVAVKAEYINPFISATVEVFATMLGCELKRGALSLNQNFQPAHEISGIIGLSGKASGTVVVSVGQDVAIAATEVMLGNRPDSVTTDVIDAVGELTNMIAGRAKAMLEQLEMNLALPTVITGQNHTIRFGSGAKTICVPYSCAWGELTVEVGLVDAEEMSRARSSALAGAV
jgi:chemotaxis protein CheX